MADGDGTYHSHDEALDKAYDRTLMVRLLKYLKPHIWLVLLAALLVISTVTLRLVPSWIIGITADTVKLQVEDKAEGPSRDMAPRVFSDRVEKILQDIDETSETLEERVERRRGLITIFGIIFLGAVTARWLFEYGEGLLLTLLGQRVILSMRMQVYRHLQSLSLKFFDRNPVGRLVTRVTNDINAISEMFSEALITIIGDMFLIAGIAIFMFKLNWRLALVALTVMPLLFITASLFRFYVRRAYRNVRAKLAAMNAFLAETLLGMKTVQMFHQEERKLKEFSKLNREYLKEVYESIKYSSWIRPIATSLSSAGIALIIWYGGRSILAGVPDITLGTLISFIWLSQMFFHPIIDITQKYYIIQSAMASSERVFRLLDNEPLITNKPDAERPLGIRGHVEFRNVWFRYDDESDWVLKDVSFVIKPGESIAIVGETGAGKSSIINLIFRFYDIQKGQILFDGIDVRDIDMQTLRSHLSLVLQDVFIFSGDVAYNIHLGADIPMERVIENAKYVNAHRFIEKMEGGYHGDVHERGSALSAGQRQLVAFARALAFNPSVLILDEATSNVDTETELLIRDALRKLIMGRTSIIVAHRLSTIKHVDWIVVLHKGEVMEKGTQQELLRKRGLFYRFYQLQAIEEAVAGE